MRAVAAPRKGHIAPRAQGAAPKIAVGMPRPFPVAPPAPVAGAALRLPPNLLVLGAAFLAGFAVGRLIGQLWSLWNNRDAHTDPSNMQWGNKFPAPNELAEGMYRPAPPGFSAVVSGKRLYLQEMRHWWPYGGHPSGTPRTVQDMPSASGTDLDHIYVHLLQGNNIYVGSYQQSVQRITPLSTASGISLVNRAGLTVAGWAIGGFGGRTIHYGMMEGTESVTAMGLSFIINGQRWQPPRRTRSRIEEAGVQAGPRKTPMPTIRPLANTAAGKKPKSPARAPIEPTWGDRPFQHDVQTGKAALTKRPALPALPAVRPQEAQPERQPVAPPAIFPSSDPARPTVPLLPGGRPAWPAAAPPATTPATERLYGGVRVGAPAAAPAATLAGIAQEVGRLEEKSGAMLELLQSLGDGAVADGIAEILSILRQPWPADAYELQPPCEDAPPDVAQFPAADGPLQALALRMDALALLMQYAKDQRQPVCRRQRAQGQAVTVTFDEVP